ncbi:PREDICTED: ATP-dependent RNA helicase DEAH11, chloroplastic-like [Camelina sativa]|uniref:RBR-type E3 ubiquitin transferase n=1 Tax=Camelina sativa TaxID=90675 RepID=A0ABM0XC55_CAMSA|nr:PREDICTED: ATP-dependent RNA helicase DEAH11, chloroplastic-like [Camelina sativa]
MDNDLELAIKNAGDLKRVDQGIKDPLLAQDETKLDLDKESSSTITHTYRLNSKGLVSEELIKDDNMMVVGLGLSLCASHDDTKLETNKALRNQKLAHPEAAELAAIIRGFKWALELGVRSIQFFCDDSNILAYVTRKATPNESIVAKLLEQVFLLQTRFTSCQALAAESRDINSVIKLAKDAIASQTRWCEGDTEYESCPVCYAYVSPNDKFEVSGCFHRICVTCMRKPFSSEQILRGNTAICPYPDCENDLVPEDCRGFADDDAITLMIQRKKEKAIPVKDRVYCPNPSCSFLMSDLDLVRNNPQQTEARKCMECGLSFCKKCHVPWHYKKTCDEFKKSESYLKSDAALLESFVKTQGWKKCSQCQSIVQHGGGCKQIPCRNCKHEFCYTCGAACKKKKLTCKCSRSGK